MRPTNEETFPSPRDKADARVRSGSSLRLRRPSCSTGSLLGLGTHCLGSSDWVPSISFTAPLTSNRDTPSTVEEAATHLGRGAQRKTSAGESRPRQCALAMNGRAHALGAPHRQAAAQAGVPHKQRVTGAHACGVGRAGEASGACTRRRRSPTARSVRRAQLGARTRDEVVLVAEVVAAGH